MPFIRHLRDKRGYESTCVLHAYRGGTGVGRPRVLYLFRSPSNVKIGRKPLDAEVIEALEHMHPDLVFDWTGMQREPAAAVPPPDIRRGRPARPERPPRPAAARIPAPAEPAALALEDESLLGRTLGARDAARVRARYNDVLQRVGRRAPSPEERDRLTEQATRLNPDEWTDAPAVTAGAASIDADLDAVLAELPRRRRGRRAGRRRERPASGSEIISTEQAEGEDDDRDPEPVDEEAPAAAGMDTASLVGAREHHDGDSAGAAPAPGAAETAHDQHAGGPDADVPRVG